MMQALRTTKASTKGVFIGWIGALTQIVEGNALNKRDVRDPKLLTEVGKVSRKQTESVLNKHIKRADGRITLPIKFKL